MMTLDAAFSRPFCLEYKWETKGLGNLLILEHTLHLQLLSSDECNVEVLDELIYESMDGNLTGVVGDSWVLKTNPIPISWHSIRGVDNEAIQELVSSLITDVEGLNSKSITNDSSYFYDKLISRASRLALIAEQICLLHVIPEVLDGKFDGNGFLFDPKWGGIVCKKCLVDSKEYFGFGVYNITITILQSTSEAVNAYYSVVLLGLSYGDMELVAISSTISSMEIQATQTWWHVKEGSGRQYEHEFRKHNRVVGVLWSNKRESGLWFAPPDWIECRILFSDLVFVRELVKWESALKKLRSLEKYDDGNSRTNSLWWIHSRKWRMV
ncbi:hypothetical protein MKX03_012927 [Papaver bracteatum]|nr:hypothetical protein MKX03_012927 [Papaver bracteatum]